MNKDSDDIGTGFTELQQIAPDTKIAASHGIAAIALAMALKYHGMMMIPDGLTYQQYKMEGRNIRVIGLHDVFETAMQIEMHLLASSDRIAKVISDALVLAVDDEEIAEGDEPQDSSASIERPEGT